MKRQPCTWISYFPSIVLIKDFDSEYAKEISIFSSKKTSNRIEVGKWFEDTSPNKTYMTHKGIIKHLLSLLTREMQIKITIRLQYRHIRMAKSKKTDQSKYWSGCGRHAHWETAWQFLRKLKINSYHTIQTILRNVPHRKESICPNTYMSTFFNDLYF